MCACICAFALFCDSAILANKHTGTHTAKISRTHPMKSITIVAYVLEDLSIDKLGGDLIEARVVPWSEQLLAVE